MADNIANGKPAQTETHALSLARQAGLHRAVDLFPDDVSAAGEAAAEVQGVLRELDDLDAEPWPPMRAKCPP